jgi:hypothetical protein
VSYGADQAEPYRRTAVFVDDEEFLQKFCSILNDHKGLLISEIGNLDIPW